MELHKFSLKNRQSYIRLRISEHGDLQALRWMVSYYGKATLAPPLGAYGFYLAGEPPLHLRVKLSRREVERFMVETAQQTAQT